MKKSIVAYLTVIGIIEKHCKNRTGDHLTFDDKKEDPHPYSRVLVISISMDGVNIPKVLVDIGSDLNILYTNTFKWMGISLQFLQPY